MPDPTLEQAYLRTRYIVDHPCGEIALRVGQRSAKLEHLLRQANCESWAFISACNPGSRPLTRAENGARHTALLAQVRALGKTFYTGRGVADDDGWCETSVLILDLDVAGARALGRAFGQHAVVAGQVGGTAELHWCKA